MRTRIPMRFIAADMYFQCGLVGTVIGLVVLVFWVLQKHQVIPVGKDPATLSGALVIMGVGLVFLVAWKITTKKALRWLESNPL